MPTSWCRWLTPSEQPGAVGGVTDRGISAGGSGLEPEFLDHEREFVALVCRRAPAEYEALAASPRFRALLKQDNRFNHGQLYAWAEFTVFRREFLHRFRQASEAACINAFCRLFLKNDISITRLAEALEGPEALDGPAL